MQQGTIFNVQRYSVHDGPGIRTTVFLKGCPLRCAWCHNPEGISSERELITIEGRCLGCGECRRACPADSEYRAAGTARTHAGRCRLCGKCVEACPAEARRMVGRKVTVSELLQEALRDRVFYEESGGGVTFSGGEPLAQPEFLLSILRACKERGLHTTVDTCGMVSTRHLLAVSRFTDLFLYDLKLMDESRHLEFTGVSNALILQNLQALAEAHPAIWIRVPVIPGVNDALVDLEATAAFAGRLSSVRQVNLLPYHRNGVAKSARVGRTAELVRTASPTRETMSKAQEIFERAGLRTLIGG